MAYTRGRCTNFDFCIVADSRRDVEVPVGQDFSCPECGKPLRAPPVQTDGTGLAVAAMIGLGALTLVSGALYLGIRLGEAAHGRATPAAVAAAAPGSQNGPVGTAAAPVPPAAASLSRQPAALSIPSPAEQSETVLLRIAGSRDMSDALVPALAAAFLAESGDSDVQTAPGTRPGEIKVSGRRADHAEAILVTGSSAADGFRELAGGGADVVMAARPMLPGERGALTSVGMTTPASENVVALDALAVVVNPSNTLAALRLDQVRSVFGGATRDWAAIGGRDSAASGGRDSAASGGGPIHLYVVARPSELGDSFSSMALDGGDFAPGATAEADAAAVAQAVAADPRGIGFTDLPHIGRLRPLAIAAGGAPRSPADSFAVAFETYKLTFPLYFYLPGTVTDKILDSFVKFAASPDGQKLAQTLGFVSPTRLPPTVTLSPLAPENLRKFVGNARRLPIEIRFAANANVLDADGQHEIDQLAQMLAANNIPGDRIILAGFGDPHVRPSVSLSNSRQRADAVAILLAGHGLRPAQVDGFGTLPPAADANRRVEVYLLP